MAGVGVKREIRRIYQFMTALRYLQKTATQRMLEPVIIYHHSVTQLLTYFRDREFNCKIRQKTLGEKEKKTYYHPKKLTKPDAFRTCKK